jgi:hypothetical protein
MEATQNRMKADLALVEEAARDLGFTHICPESLMAIGDSLEDALPEVRGAYRRVMAGFRALLLPAGA